MSLPWAPDAGNIFLAVAPLTAIAAVVQFVGNIMRLNMLLVLADNPGMTIVRDQRDDVTITITAVRAPGCCTSERRRCGHSLLISLHDSLIRSPS